MQIMNFHIHLLVSAASVLESEVGLTAAIIPTSSENLWKVCSSTSF